MYYVIRQSEGNLHSIIGLFEHEEGILDRKLLIGAYIPIADVSGGESLLMPENGLTVSQHVQNNLAILTRTRIPVLRHEDGKWSYLMDRNTVTQIRLAQYEDELETYLNMVYVPIEDRVRVMLEADHAQHRLARTQGLEPQRVRALAHEFLLEEDNARRTSVYGKENFKSLLKNFPLRRLFRKLGTTELDQDQVLIDVRAVFGTVLLGRVFREQKFLLNKYAKDIAQVAEAKDIVEYYIPNRFKPF
jgi:hypothetical protein